MPRWLLVEVHGPWGSDAVAQSELGPHAPAVWRRALQQRGVRIITIRRDLDRRHFEAQRSLRLVYVVPPRPGGLPVVARTDLVDLHDVVAATEWLVAGGEPTSHWYEDPDPYVLVCTNGKHDPCCAVQGRPIVRELRDTAWDEHLWECSHIGGDRFAGNVVVLPDGLYFGRCTPEDTIRVLAARVEGRLDMTRLRGRCTLSLTEQAAEHHVRRTRHLDALDAVVGVTTRGDGLVEISVQSGDGPPETVEVEVSRTTVDTLDALTCKGSPDQHYGVFTAVTVGPRGR